MTALEMWSLSREIMGTFFFSLQNKISLTQNRYILCMIEFYWNFSGDKWNYSPRNWIINELWENQRLEIDLYFLNMPVSPNKIITLVALVVNNLPANSRDVRNASSIPVLGRSLEEGMATHSSIHAWRILRTEESGRQWSIGLQRVRQDWSNLAHTHLWNKYNLYIKPYVTFPRNQK